MEHTKQFLGQGFSFPPRLDETTGRFVLCSAEEDIRQSIGLILTTKKRERAMLPDFGCDIQDYVFGLPDSASLAMARRSIVEALTDWEPRIINVQVQADLSDLSDGKIVFNISYIVRATNNPNNLVFPYYLYEGVGV